MCTSSKHSLSNSSSSSALVTSNLMRSAFGPAFGGSISASSGVVVYRPVNSATSVLLPSERIGIWVKFDFTSGSRYAQLLVSNSYSSRSLRTTCSMSRLMHSTIPFTHGVYTWTNVCSVLMRWRRSSNSVFLKCDPLSDIHSFGMPNRFAQPKIAVVVIVLVKELDAVSSQKCASARSFRTRTERVMSDEVTINRKSKWRTSSLRQDFVAHTTVSWITNPPLTLLT